MGESVDVVATCAVCGLTYVEATRIGQILRFTVNAACPRCSKAPPRRPPKRSRRGAASRKIA